MRKVKMKEEQGRKRLSRFVGMFDKLEDRCLLAPIPVFGTVWQSPADAPGVYRGDGFVSVRLISTQPGRIEADPTGAFGNDVFVISRGTTVGTGGIIASGVNGGDQPGRIYLVDPYAVNAFGTPPSLNRIPFASIPGGGASFGGYENWFDLAFDPTGNFTTVDGGPTLYVSTLDSTTTPGINSRNAVYAFRPDGSLVAPVTGSNPTGVYAYSTLDTVHPGLLDSQIGVLAVAPGDAFGRNLYLLDVACDNQVGVTCAAGDGNAIYGVTSTEVASTLPSPINLDSPPGALNGHVEGILPPLTPVPANNDYDPRAVVFDPNRGILLQGQFAEQAFQLYGGMFVASSDIESADTGVSRILHFPSLGFPPIDMIPPVPVQLRMIGDMAFDPVGHFGGGLFFTDYVTRSVYQVIQDPTTGLGNVFQIASNFDILNPTQFLPTDPPGVTPAEAYRDAFSITFSADGEIMFVSDRDGIWAFYASTLGQSAAGAAFGLDDIRELHAPYTGQGLAAAVLDTGVDGQHLGFRGTVAGGYNPSFPSTGNFDTDIHGTAVAGIVHQIAPDAVIVPINVLGYEDSCLCNNGIWKSLKFVADHPFVDDPRTPGINESVNDPATPQDDRVRIVTANMSFGIRFNTDPSGTLDSELEAFNADRGAVIAFNAVFERFRQLGIVPVASAGNTGQLFNGVSGAATPAILNNVVQVIAAYPFGPTPPNAGPPLTINATAVTGDRCTLEAGDLIAFPGKITAFSNRSILSDFATPGSCVPSYARSLFIGSLSATAQALAVGPLLQEFNGTSAASPIVAGSFVFSFDVLSQWGAVAAAGGVISPIDNPANTADDKMAKLNQYLTRELLTATGFPIPPSTLGIGTAAAHLAPYMTQDGINSILQWTAIPREDVNIGEGFTTPNGVDDDVAQQRLRFSSHYRTYSHLNIANFLSAVEGSIALNYFVAHPGELTQLASAAGAPFIITASDIDNYVADVTNSPTDRAMALLLGGDDRIARRNRLTYLDLVQNQRQDGGILADPASIAALQARILPKPTDFVINNRFASANKAYALDSTAVRNYHDLNYTTRGGMLAPRVPAKLKKLSPDQINTGTTHSLVDFLPVPGRQPSSPIPSRAPDLIVVGHSGDNMPASLPGDLPPVVPPSGGSGNSDLPPSNNPPGGGATNTQAPNNFVTMNESGTEFIYHTSADGNLLESSRSADGTWVVSDITTSTQGPKIQSDLLALDLAGAFSRAVFGLTADGHVVRYEFNGNSWSAVDITAGSNLPTISSSLVGLVLHRGPVDTVVLYGLNAAGQLIEYRPGRLGWTARNISRDTGGAPLQPGVVCWGEVYMGKYERIFVYGTVQGGHVNQYSWFGKRWARLDLSGAPYSPHVTPASLVLVQPRASGALPAIYGLDDQGSLWGYTGNLRLGWNAITPFAGGPALTGELTAQFEPGTNTTYIFGRNSDGQVVQFAGSDRLWSWSLLGTSNSASNGDIAASNTYRSVYSELVDGTLAEFYLGDAWNVRVMNSNTNTPGAADGSTATGHLISLALASR